MEKKGAAEKKAKAKKEPHIFGPPEERAKGYEFPSKNPQLFTYSGKTASSLPDNLKAVFEVIEKAGAQGVSLKSLKVSGLSTKTVAWLTRQLAKHSFVRVVAEEKAETKKPAPKAKAVTTEKRERKATIAHAAKTRKAKADTPAQTDEAATPKASVAA
jgi:hypothetical protein